MRGVFVDANESLAVIFERLHRDGDPEVRINRDPDITPDQHRHVAGADIFSANQGNIGRLDHGVDRLHRADKALRFDHA